MAAVAPGVDSGAGFVIEAIGGHAGQQAGLPGSGIDQIDGQSAFLAYLPMVPMRVENRGARLPGKIRASS